MTEKSISFNILLLRLMLFSLLNTRISQINAGNIDGLEKILHVVSGFHLEAVENHTETRMWITETRKPKWIAHKAANWGDHYRFVAIKSVLVRAIPKERLTKRGLVSLSDYYLKVAYA